jgi:ligand-binding SRPBCC domain-containing protein
MGGVYFFDQEDWLPKPLSEVFAFFGDAENLERITPPWLSFKIVPPYPKQMAVGVQIEYRLKLHGFPIRWTTKIAEWDPPFRFVDVQLRGPYRVWEHTHTFESEGEGTRMKDHVRYQLPFGWLGRVAHELSVRKDIQRIFAFRSQQIPKLFDSH